MTWVNWLDNELNERNWSYADLARRSGINESTFSRIRSGGRKPGFDTCRSVAKALNLPYETVYRQAGLLPDIISKSPLQDEFELVISQMDEEQQEIYLNQGRAIIEQRNRRRKKKARQQDGAEIS